MNGMPEKKWYIVHTYSGHEAKVKQSLLERAKSFHREGEFDEILIPEDPSAAAAHLEAAVRTLEDVGARDELARALVAQASLLRVAGERVGTRRLLERALALFQELGTLDERPRVRAALAALDLAKVDQGLLIVSRDEPGLYQHLARELAGRPNVQVFLDRRRGERRQPGGVKVPDRRRADRRSGPEADAMLRSVGYAIVAQAYSAY